MQSGSISSGFTPQRVLILGFFAVISVGAVLLYSPAASAGGGSISFIDSLFTSTSAVCVTGLIVKDLSRDFSYFGQGVILVLIQLGGLGYMTSATILFLMIGKKIGLKDRLVIQEALNIYTLSGLIRFTKNILRVTLIFESLGALVLSIRFGRDLPFLKAVWYGLFHSVSAFNNAGFSLFSDSLVSYREDVTVNMVIAVLIISGGAGFIVISDIYKYTQGKVFRLSAHTKISLVVTGLLLFMGMIYILTFESGNPRTLGVMTWGGRILAAFFQSVTARTAGFNTIDISGLTIPSMLLVIFLMYVGASSGSTGGGIKTSTFGVMIISLWSSLRGGTDVVVYKRRLPNEVVTKAFLIASLAGLTIVFMNLLIMIFEDRDFLSSLFEVVSAFGTVGLSVGDGGTRSLSALFSPAGRLVIILTMFIGRLGPLTVGAATLRSVDIVRIRRPEEKVLIG